MSNVIASILQMIASNSYNNFLKGCDNSKMFKSSYEIKQESFEQVRRSGIGGSDIASILGIKSAFKTRQQIWDEKFNGFYEPPRNKYAMMLGKMLELPMIMHYQAIYGTKVEYSSGDTFLHDEHPYFFAHVDAYIPSEKKIVEVKTASEKTKHLWGADGTSAIPAHYYAQVAHYMLVLDYEFADLIVGFMSDAIKEEITERLSEYFLGNYSINLNDIPQKIEVRRYSFKRDRNMDDVIIHEGKEFWKNYVLRGIQPDSVHANPFVGFCGG